MKPIIYALMLVSVCCTGCTSLALEEYTLAQVRSVGDLRDREVLHCLAQVAAHPEALPAFSISSDGITRITDQINLNAVTTWTRAAKGFATQSLMSSASRAPQGTWTVDTVGDYERLEALRCACLWALRNGKQQCGVDCEILEDPRLFPNGKPHFGVADRLARLPAGWVQVGHRKDVPHKACYQGHCGHTWVWVMPECAEAFAQFELAILEIALLDDPYWPRLLVTLERDDVTKVKDVSDLTKNQAVVVQENRAVKPEYRELIEDHIRDAMRKTGQVKLTYAQWLEYTVPYHGQRTTQSTSLISLPTSAITPALTLPFPNVTNIRPLDRANRSVTP